MGPESAGADPGPICYGRGGERPTLTDAMGNVRNVVRVDLRADNGVIHLIDGILFPM